MEATALATSKRVEQRETIVVRLAGDSGDGMQLAGTQFTTSTVIFGNDISTFPDYPAEIRAPAGSLAGVSGFQINFGSQQLFTPGDSVDCLVAMNAAALKVNLKDVGDGGIIIVNSNGFEEADLRKAEYKSNPLTDGALGGCKLYQVPITKMTEDTLKDSGLTTKAIARCKNFFALGLLYWMYDRPMEPTLNWIQDKFGKNPTVAGANTSALKAGYAFGETTEMFTTMYRVEPATIPPGTYRNVTGNEATAIGMITAATLAGKSLFYGSYPITPASDILHFLSSYKNFNVRTFQAEDEIAAICTAIGASFSGELGVTGTSGPGMSLKSEAIGLAVMTELPLVIVDVQRGGPSTGLPTKTEQADLLMAMFGRHGECPLPILAPATPADCFDIIVEAFRIAVKYMTPIIVLSDGYLANGSEPWRIPDAASLPRIPIAHATKPEGFHAYARDEHLARPWAIPGTPGLEHRLGGLEKDKLTGMVSYDPENHETMVKTRAAKVDKIVADVPDIVVDGPESGDLLIVSWGSTYGAIHTAVNRIRRDGKQVSHAHLRYLRPFPANLGEVVHSFKRVLIPELNAGQLRVLLQNQFLIDSVGLNKIQGKPFFIAEIVSKINSILSEMNK